MVVHLSLIRAVANQKNIEFVFFFDGTADVSSFTLSLELVFCFRFRDTTIGMLLIRESTTMLAGSGTTFNGKERLLHEPGLSILPLYSSL